MNTPTSTVSTSDTLSCLEAGPIQRLQAHTSSIYCTSHKLRRAQDQNEAKINFNPHYRMPPTITCGLTGLDVGADGVRIKIYADDIRQDSFYIHLDSWAGTSLYLASCTWLETIHGESDFQVGGYRFTYSPNMNTSKLKYSQQITFDHAFDESPNVIVWLNYLDMSPKHNTRVRAHSSDITPSGFTIHIGTWTDSIIYGGGASWIAYPAERPETHSGNVSSLDYRTWKSPQRYNGGDVVFPENCFQSIPKVLLAVNFLDFSCCHNLRFRAFADGIWQGGMKWHADSWSDSICYGIGAAYLAFV